MVGADIGWSTLWPGGAELAAGLARLDVGVTEHRKNDNESRQGWSPVYRYAGMGLELGAAITGFTLVGVWADYHLGTRPTGVIVGVILGTVGGLYNFIREALALSRQQSKPTTKPGDADRRDNHRPKS